MLHPLEARTLFAAPALATLPDVTLLAGTQLQIPLDGSDADGDALSYSVAAPQGLSWSLSNPANRSLKINVAHASSGAGDPAFTGTMTLSLFEDRAPKTTQRIIQLAQQGFYNNLTFHRVINDFMIQGGDPLGTGTGGSGQRFDDEYHADLRFTGRGLIAMAKSLDDTNDSQFFITEGTPRHLDFNHTIFGQLVEGESVREQISNVPKNASDKPLAAVTMTSVTVQQDTQNRVLSISVPAGTTGTGVVTVTVSDGKGGTAQRQFQVTIAADTTNSLPFLNPIADVHATANTPTQIQLAATDVDGGPLAYMDWYTIRQNYPNQSLNLPPHPALDVDAITNVSTGATTIELKNNAAGVFPLYFGVTQNNGNYVNGFDSQVVPLFVTPAAPTGIDLVDASDTGPASDDNVTRLTNANASTRLQFRITGVVAGAEVKLFDGVKLLGTAVVPAGQTEVVLTTNGSSNLSDGVHNLTASQSLNNLSWAVGNRTGVTTLASVTSAALLALRVDTAAPTQTAAATTTHLTPPGPSVSYVFSEDVGASLSAGDVLLRNLTTQQDLPNTAVQISWDAAAKRATFAFPGLPDGDYRVTRVAGGITDLAGNAVSTAATPSDFFVLGGDANRDRKVDFDDLLALAQSYNAPSGKTLAQGDFNYDGAVDFDDLLTLAQRYNTGLSPAGAVMAQPAAAAMSFDQATAAAFSTATARKQNQAKAKDERPAKTVFATATPATKPMAKKPALTKPATRR